MTVLCAVYARISDELLQTGEDKVSIQTQIDDCRARAAALGAVVVSEFVDDKRYRTAAGVMVDPAGWRADRPQWQAMLAAAERGEFGLVIAWHSTRLFRGYRPMADLLDVAERRKLRVECVKDSFSTDLAPIYAWAAKQERQAFAARSAMGKIGRAKRGLPTTRAPAHYMKVVDAAGRTVGYEIIPAARPWLAEIARRYLDGDGLHKISNALYSHPITGTRLSARSIADVLSNPYNYGLIAAYQHAPGGQVGEYAGTHEPAWPPEICVALQAERAKRRYPSVAKVRGAGIFSGVVRCGECGRVMALTQNGTKPNIYKEYFCWRAKAYKEHPSVSILERKLVRLVRELMAGVTDNDLAEALQALTFAPGLSAEALAELADRRAAVADQLTELEADLAAVRSPAARQAVAGQILELQTQLEAVDGQIVQAGRGGPPVEPAELLARAKRLREPGIWHLPPVELRAIISRSIPALYVLKGRLVQAPKES